MATAPLQLKDSKDGTMNIPGLSKTVITNPQEMESLLTIAKANRKVSATKMNAASSRSHSVFILDVDSIVSDGNKKTAGQLIMIDLAGSERSNVSGVTSGPAFEELKAINQSLSCLGNCLNALSTNNNHVPFRDNTLTKLLQPVLCKGNGGKCLMVVNVSSEVEYENETLNSLNFAKKAGGCQVGGGGRK